MTVQTQCTLCEKNPMEPHETKGGIFYKCSVCDSASVPKEPKSK